MSYCQKFYNYILLYDDYAPGPSLNHLGSPKYTTLLGLAITIGSIVIAFIGNNKYLQDAIYNTNPTIISSVSLNLKPQLMNKSSFKFYLQIQYLVPETRSLKMIKIEDYPKIAVQKVFFSSNQFSPSLLTGRKRMTFLENCKEKSNDQIFEGYNDGMIFSSEKLTEKELQKIKETSLCFPTGFNETLTNFGIASVGLGFMHEAFSKLSIKYKYPIAISLQHQEVVLDPESSDKRYKLICKTESLI